MKYGVLLLVLTKSRPLHGLNSTGTTMIVRPLAWSSSSSIISIIIGCHPSPHRIQKCKFGVNVQQQNRHLQIYYVVSCAFL